MNSRQPERFAMVLPVYDTVAEDPKLLAKLEEHARTDAWADAVRRAGGRLHESPIEVEYIDNPHYLVEYTYKDEDGNTVVAVNHVKMDILVKGWAIRLDA